MARVCEPLSIGLPFSTLRLPLLERRTALAMEFRASVACLITSVRSAPGVFSASSIAVTAALTLATADFVFGKPIDLARYSPISAEILDRRLRSSSAFLLTPVAADSTTAAFPTVVTISEA